MSHTSIQVSDLGKQYRLGLVGTGTLSHDLNRWWHLMRGKPDPYLKIGAVNRRDEASDDAYVWALRGIDFEARQGEVLGIIGSNGAGKSTLLKILSRVTAPTTGYYRARGRIASLLEVGTGFHKELTGRENIFLNGAILGMTKAEVRRKLDEIVDFSGVARYVDTPVKRYSSGMKVRLAFAVAAHLEPEILIVDEVLAVGDAAFQKKAIGKMQEVSSGGGRTVLFVSHNMEAVARLCTRGIVLSDGQLSYDGPVGEAIKHYTDLNFSTPQTTPLKLRTDRRGTGQYRYADAWLEDLDGNRLSVVQVGAPLRIVLRIEGEGDKPRPAYAGVGIRDANGNPVTLLSGWSRAQRTMLGGVTEVVFEIPRLPLLAGDYLIDAFLEDGVIGGQTFDNVQGAATLAVEGNDFFGSGQQADTALYKFYQDFEQYTR